jgi:putative PIN family toxin of toxin-antitoxin system
LQIDSAGAIIGLVVKRIILDTNVLVAALTSSKGASRAVLRGALLGLWQPLISLPLFLEYEDVMARREVLQRCPLPDEERQALLDALLSRCELIEVYYAWRPNLRDEGDNHVFELAVAAQDAALLTWNVRDFAGAELRFPQVTVMTPARWMKENS